MTTGPKASAERSRPAARAQPPTATDGPERSDEVARRVDRGRRGARRAARGLKRERDEYLELAQRAKADFENYRKRTAREAADAERRGKLALARELVPVDRQPRAGARGAPSQGLRGRAAASSWSTAS